MSEPTGTTSSTTAPDTGTGTGTQTASTDTTSTATTTDTTTTDKAVDHKAEAEKWKDLARKHEQRAKENAEAAKRLKTIEDRDMSELDKAKRDLAEATERASKAERDRLVAKVALAKGLPAELADRLVGSDEDELAADADRLLTLVKGTAANSPKPDRSQGAGPDMALNGDPLLRDLMEKVGVRGR